MKNIFEEKITSEVINRIESLSSDSKANWGKMNVDQMLAHCNVTYEMVYDNIHEKPKGLKKWLIKTFVKNAVVSEKSYKKNGMTAPEFLIKNEKEFNKEKERLIAYLNKTQALGGEHFNNKESHSFGKLTTQEWNNMFYKHLDHHLSQFGV